MAIYETKGTETTLSKAIESTKSAGAINFAPIKGAPSNIMGDATEMIAKAVGAISKDIQTSQTLEGKSTMSVWKNETETALNEAEPHEYQTILASRAEEFKSNHLSNYSGKVHETLAASFDVIYSDLTKVALAGQRKAATNSLKGDLEAYSRQITDGSVPKILGAVDVNAVDIEITSLQKDMVFLEEMANEGLGTVFENEAQRDAWLLGVEQNLNTQIVQAMLERDDHLFTVQAGNMLNDKDIAISGDARIKLTRAYNARNAERNRENISANISQFGNQLTALGKSASHYPETYANTSQFIVGLRKLVFDSEHQPVNLGTASQMITQSIVDWAGMQTWEDDESLEIAISSIIDNTPKDRFGNPVPVNREDTINRIRNNAAADNKITLQEIVDEAIETVNNGNVVENVGALLKDIVAPGLGIPDPKQTVLEEAAKELARYSDENEKTSFENIIAYAQDNNMMSDSLRASLDTFTGRTQEVSDRDASANLFISNAATGVDQSELHPNGVISQGVNNTLTTRLSNGEVNPATLFPVLRENGYSPAQLNWTKAEYQNHVNQYAEQGLEPQLEFFARHNMTPSEARELAGITLDLIPGSTAENAPAEYGAFIWAELPAASRQMYGARTRPDYTLADRLSNHAFSVAPKLSQFFANALSGAVDATTSEDMFLSLSHLEQIERAKTKTSTSERSDMRMPIFARDLIAMDISEAVFGTATNRKWTLSEISGVVPLIALEAGAKWDMAQGNDMDFYEYWISNKDALLPVMSKAFKDNYVSVGDFWLSNAMLEQSPVLQNDEVKKGFINSFADPESEVVQTISGFASEFNFDVGNSAVIPTPVGFVDKDGNAPDSLYVLGATKASMNIGPNIEFCIWGVGSDGVPYQIDEAFVNGVKVIHNSLPQTLSTDIYLDDAGIAQNRMFHEMLFDQAGQINDFDIRNFVRPKSSTPLSISTQNSAYNAAQMQYNYQTQQ